jgi:hypothetical protein
VNVSETKENAMTDQEYIEHEHEGFDSFQQDIVGHTALDVQPYELGLWSRIRNFLGF